MDKTRIWFRYHRLIMGATLFFFLGFPFQGTASSSLSFDFEGSAADEWTTRDTYDIEGNRVLGLFNDRNRKYLAQTHLNLKDLPPQTPVTLSFDLYLVGTWDSSGKLSDRWTLSVEGGPILLDLTGFPNTFADKEDKNPIGNKGLVQVGDRKRAYWVARQTVVIPPEQIVDGRVSLRFQGFLTGRKTEFWGLDDVKVTVGK